MAGGKEDGATDDKKKRLAPAAASKILREDKIHPRQCKDDNEKKKRAHACLLDLTCSTLLADTRRQTHRREEKAVALD